MKTFRYILVVFLLIAIIGCKKDDDNNNNNTPPDNSAVKEALVNSSNKFGIELFKKVNNNNDDNVMISPLSVSIALGMTYNGAAGTTQEAMKETLGYEGLSKADINVAYKSMIDVLTSLDQDITLDIANSIWIKENFEVLQDFIDNNTTYFYSEVNNLDFASPDAVDIINAWIAENTNNKITEVLESIPPNAVMYLINAIYFNANWKYQFDEEATSTMPFYKEDGTIVDVEMMNQRNLIKYKSTDLYDAIELPYGNNDFSMLIFLPEYSCTVNDIIDEMDYSTWNSWCQGFSADDSLDLYMPKFKFEYDSVLNDILSDMGMEIAFTEGAADFSNINPNVPLNISNVIHKTYIDVNEAGTEAAAVTVVEIVYTSVDDGTLRLNKPFVYAIKDSKTNSILFIGKVMEPSY